MTAGGSQIEPSYNFTIHLPVDLLFTQLQVYQPCSLKKALQGETCWDQQSPYHYKMMTMKPYDLKLKLLLD